MLPFQARYVLGYNGTPALWSGPDEVAFTCGNAVVFQTVSNKAQRVLKGTGFGISCFAIDKKHHLLAIAEKGLTPHVAIYSTTSLQLLGSISPGAPLKEGEPNQGHPHQQRQDAAGQGNGDDKQQYQPPVVVMGVTAMAFSGDGERLAVCGDEPDCSVIIYNWRKGEALVRGRAPAAVCQASFHPYDPSILATTGGGKTAVWYIEQLWDRSVFRHTVLGQQAEQVRAVAAAATAAANAAAAAAAAQATSGAPDEAAAVQAAAERAAAAAGETAAADSHADGAVSPSAEQPQWRLASGQEPTAHAWSPYGLYCGTNDGTLLLLDLSTMQPVLLPGSGAHQLAGEGEDGRGHGGWGNGAVFGPSSGSFAVVPNCVGPGGGVAAIAVNRDHVAVTGTDGSVHVFDALGAGGHAPAGFPSGQLGHGMGSFTAGHGGHPGGGGGGLDRALPQRATGGALEFSHEIWLGRSGASGVAVSSADLGGPDSATLLLGCPDGMLYRAAVAPHKGAGSGARAGYTLATLLMDCHVGPLAGVVPHPGGGAFVTTGADGSVRVWAATDGAMLAKRTLSSAQSALAAANPGVAVVAVGSETGVVRIITLPPPPTPGAPTNPTSLGASAGSLNAPLRVMFRRRLHAGRVDALVFSPDNELAASVGRDGTVWLLSVHARSGTVRPLGFVNLPAGERALGATWPRVSDSDESLLVSLAGGGLMCLAVAPELASGNWRNPHADMALLRPAGPGGGGRGALGSETGESGTGPGGAGCVGDPVSIKLLRIEVPLLTLASTPGERFGDVYGLGADKQLHKVVLPADAAAWAGLRARAHRSAIHVPAHSRAAGCVAVTPGHQLLVSGGGDGLVTLRNMSLIALATTAPTDSHTPHPDGVGVGGAGPHDVTAGGVAGVSFDASGRYFASAGGDGVVCVYELGVGGTAAAAAQATQHVLAPPPALVPPAPAGGVADLDDLDDPAELTEVAALQRDATVGVAGATGEARRAAVASRLADLRSRISQLLAANEAAPELERLNRSDMIVDVGLVEQLKHEAEVRVEAVQAAVKAEHLQTELLADRVRRMVWDSMATKGAVVSGLRASTAVHNFPLTQLGPSERTLKQVALLRRVEMAEHQASKQAGYQALFRGGGGENAGHDEDGGEAPPGDTMLRATSAAAPLDPGAASSGDVSALLYSDFDLHCTTRKALQMHLIQQKIRDLKAAFNADFDRLAAQKRSDCDRIADLHARLDDTLKDLRKLGAAPSAGLLEERFTLTNQDTRDNLQLTVLTVRPEEVQADKYVSPEEQARLDAIRRADEEATARSAKDNAGERALRQMMGGSLAARGGAGEEANPFSLPRPAWLLAMGLEPDAVNPKAITEDQARELKEWQAKEKALSEERTKRVGVLELELRTAKAAVEEAVARFDEALGALVGKRLKVAGEIAAMEARLLGLAAALARCARTAEGVERGLLSRLGAAKESHGRAAADLGDRRAVLGDLEQQQAQLLADERQLDRNFKKEFADADVHFNRLLQLYRARRPEQMAPGAPLPPAVGAGSVSAPAGPLQSYASGTVEAGGRPSAGMLSRQQSHTAASAAAAAAASDASAAHGTQAAPAPSAPPGAAPLYSHPPPTLPPGLAATSLEAFPEPPPDYVASHHAQQHPQHPQHGSRPGSQGHGAHAAHGHGHGHGAFHSHAHSHAAAAAATSNPATNPQLDPSLRPDALDVGLWERFVAYRADRLGVEAELRRVAAELALGRKDLAELEGREAGLGSELEGLMGAITALRSERRVNAYDNELQLRLLAGQVEAAPPAPGVSADMSDARLLGRGVVEALNSVVVGKGDKKVDILTAIKDFKRGIYTAQWEAAAADMTLDDLRAKVRDLQLLHVTRDMQTVLKDGEDRSSALEAASLEALMKQRERLHAKAVEDKKRRLRKLGTDISSRSGQNGEVAVHLVTLGKVLEEQQRLQAGMQGANEQAARRMRSLVTHKKLKEIALAQQRELAELRANLEKLRLRTYPTFVEAAPPQAGMPVPTTRPPPDVKVLTGGPSPATAGAKALGVGTFRPLRH